MRPNRPSGSLPRGVQPVAVLFFFLLPLLADALPHGDEHGEHSDMDMDAADGGPGASAAPFATASAAAPVADNTQPSSPTSYFAYDKHVGPIVAHIALMFVAWFFVLPVGIMFSVARSRLALPTQFLFLVINALGLLLGVIYNSQTPDMYENNAHHKIGWIATWVMSAEVVMGLLFAYAGRDDGLNSKGSAPHERAAFLPVSTTGTKGEQEQYRWSGDSGQGSERSSSSLQLHYAQADRVHRMSHYDETSRLTGKPDDDDDDKEEEEEQEEDDDGEYGVKLGSSPDRGRFFKTSFIDKFLTKRVPGLLSSRVLKALRAPHIIIERTILPLGFIAMATGGVTYGGVFKANGVFSGLAHFTKGGIFLWYGLLTLGRWMGCFADFGWAWNLKPSRAVVSKWQSRVPTGEFTESFVIFLYGCSNVFLEHLAAWGDEWSAQDLEHVSIAVLFFGGGLCGMLAESKRIRRWINNTAFTASSSHEDEQYTSAASSTTTATTELEELQPPKSQGLSLNQMPALVIFLLGLMMSSHHQTSMVSTMVHKQWGMLLVGFSMARAVTYILLYLNPPSSYLPSRPPSELIAGFCLISGGLVFMLSARDIVNAMEANDLNAMFVFTVAMGFTAFIMAWEIACISLKAWATKRSHSAIPKGFRFSA